MRTAVLAAFIIAVGIVAAGSYGLSAGAAPSLQAREDQIVVFTQPVSPGAGPAILPGYGALYNASHIAVLIDGVDYPPESMFRFEGIWGAHSGSTTCLRLFDRTADAAVSGAEVCYTIPQNTGTQDVRVRSARFSLPAGEHQYTLQGNCVPIAITTCGGSNVYATRIIAEWTERVR